MVDDPNKKKAFPSCPFPQSDDGHTVRVTRSTTRLAESAQKSSFPGELRNIVTPPSQQRKHGRGGRRGGGRGGRGWASQPVYLHNMNHAGPAKMEHNEAYSVVGTANTADSAPPEVIPLMITADSPIKVRSATKAVLTKITLVEEGTREVDVPKTKKRPAALGNSPPSKRRYTEETADGSITEVISRTTEIERDMKPKKSDVEQIMPGGNSISNLRDSRASQPVPARTLSLKNVPTANIAKLDLVDRPKWPTSRTTTKHQIKIVDLDKLMTKIDTPFIDSHCHLDFIYGRVKQETGEGGYLDEWKKKFHNAFPKNFKGCIPNFIEPDLWFDRGIKRTDIDWIRRQSPLVLGATYGVHPHEAHLYSAYLEKHLREVLTRSEFKPIAVGECGLDAQKGLANIKTEQFAAFESQVMLAKEFDLPIVIHCRGPNRDDEYLVEKKCLEIMKKVKLSRWHSIHRHCFKVDYAAYELWTRNFPNTYFGFTPLTGPIDDGLKTAIEKIPLDRMLLETDSPYFRPRQFDVSNDAGPSKCSLPGMAICAAAIIAQLKKIDVEKVLEATEQNTRRCYGLYDDIVE